MKVRDLVKDFEKKIVDFAYETENDLTESIKDEQMGVVKKGQSLRESIEKYRKSNYVSEKTRPYIEHLENQVNLIDIFFHLMNSIRLKLKLKCFSHKILILHIIDWELPSMPSQLSRGQFLRGQPPTSSMSAFSPQRRRTASRIFQTEGLTNFSPLQNSGISLGSILLSTKIRLFQLTVCGQEDRQC